MPRLFLADGQSSPYHWRNIQFPLRISSHEKQVLASPIERVETLILVIRGEKVILDADLAKLYGVSTKALNQAVRRNASRFPEDFLFSLTAKEKEEVVTNCDHLRRLRFSRTLPNAFTEHGAIMAANVLNSERAVEAGVNSSNEFSPRRNVTLIFP